METTGGRTSIFLLFLMQATLASGAGAEVKPSSNPVLAGQTLTLAVSPPTVLAGGSWSLGSAVILNWVGSQVAVFPSYTGRASVDTSTNTLTLLSVMPADSGLYTVRSADAALSASITIAALEAISNVELRTKDDDAVFVELRDSAVFTCSAKGTSPSFLWMNGSSVVATGNGVQTVDGNSTLTIPNVTRYDRGPLTCNVSNAVSGEVSQPLNLTVYYGPDHMELRGNGQNISDFLLGSDLNLSCSAQSNPPAQLQWAFRGDRLNTTGPTLRLYSVSEKDSGLYSCLAYNNATQMYSNVTKAISIASGSEQRGLTVWLLPFLSLSAFLSTFSDNR